VRPHIFHLSASIASIASSARWGLAIPRHGWTVRGLCVCVCVGHNDEPCRWMQCAEQSTNARWANGKMRACSLGLVGLGFRVWDKVLVSIRDKVGARVSDGVRISTFYFLSL